MKPFLYYLLGIMLLSSCEYKIHENFIDLEKPSDEVMMGIELNVENEGETIVLQQGNMFIQYNLVASGYKPIGCIFRIADNIIEIEGGSGSFSLDSYALSEGDYTLTCEMYLYTGSGSIAEQVGYESYMGKHEWQIKVLNPNNPERRLTQKMNNEGYLELSWEKPPVDLSSFDYYKIITYNSEVILRDVNQVSYVFNTYIGTSERVQVYAYFKNGTQEWFCGHLDLEWEELDLKINYDRKDYITITWSNPYHTVMSIKGDDGLLVDKSAERTLHIPYTTFGALPGYLIFTLEAAKPEDWVENMRMEVGMGVDRSPGTLLSPSQNWARVGYNLLLDQLYVSSYNEVASWALPSLKPTGKEGKVPYHVSDYGVSLSSDKVVVRQDAEIYILDGKELSTIKIIKIETDLAIDGEPVLTTDNKLLLMLSAYNSMRLHVYNVETGNLETSFDIPVKNKVDSRSFIDPNGKYIYFVYDAGQIGVLSLDNYRVTGQQIISAVYESWCVNPSRPEQLFVCNGGVLTQYDSQSGQKVGDWNIPNVEAGNVDPKSGLLLLYSREKIVVFDPKRGQQIYTMPVANWSPYWLFGNTLISYSGYGLYLGKELQQ